jgi:hypothetical protein
VLLKHADGLVEHGDRGALDGGLAGVEGDALDVAVEARDGVGEGVGAAVGVLEAVDGLGLVDARVDVVEDAVAVLVADRAAVGRDAGLLGARVLIVEEAVAVAVELGAAVLVLVAVDGLGLVGAGVLIVEEAVAVAVAGQRVGQRLGLGSWLGLLVLPSSARAAPASRSSPARWRGLSRGRARRCWRWTPTRSRGCR